MKMERDKTGELQLERLLDAVRNRLLVRRLAALASRNLLIALLLVMPAAIFSALRPSPHLPVAGAVVCGLGLVVALVEAAARRPGRLDAALHVDKHSALQERLSTLVSVPAADASPAVRDALVQDTLLRARSIMAGVACPLSIPRSAPFTGAALFCVAALLFGAVRQGSAERLITTNELDPMLAGSAIHVALPPDLQNELNKITGPTEGLEEALARLDEVLGKFEALNDIKASVEDLAPHALTAEDMAKLIAEAPDARARLKAALERAARELRSDKDLEQAVREAQEALAEGSDEAVARAMENLISKLSAETARHQFDKLKALKTHLAAFKEAAEDARGGVTRTIELGGATDPEAATDSILPLFPEDAVIKARGALRSGRIPARYRWLVEKYFRNDTDEAGGARPPSSGL